ncbi:MAG: hypothetical protein PS018_08530, partial [bacterium]|nr:hypothetical protein [bacterium]
EIWSFELIIAVLLFGAGGPSPRSVVEGVRDGVARRSAAGHTDITLQTFRRRGFANSAVEN